jgi:hypothetical protein
LSPSDTITGRNFWVFGPRAAGTLASVLRRVPDICNSVFCVTGARIRTLSRWNTAHCPIPSTTEPWRPQIPRNRAQNFRPEFLVSRPKIRGTLASVFRRIPCICGSVYCVTGAQIHTPSRWNTAHCPIPSTTEPWRPQIPRNRAQNFRPEFLVFRAQIRGDTCKRVTTRYLHLWLCVLCHRGTNVYAVALEHRPLSNPEHDRAVAAANPAKSSSESPAVIFGYSGPALRGHLQP